MYQFVKRGIDFTISFIACVVLSPIFIIIAVLIKADSKGPIFFGQERVGKDKKNFIMYKFRTMRVDTPHDTPTHLLEDPDKYITRIGTILRKTSLDELPQLIHILSGKMAIVGPRPALWNQFDLIELRDQYGANSLRPGLTGWAQVNGRDEVSLEKKSELDGEYVKKVSLSFDIFIFFKTITSVFHGKGIHEGKLNE